MIPELQTLIPFLQEDTLGDVSFTLLLKLLANPSMINSSSTVDQQTLLTRVVTLLKSNHSITRWKAAKLFTVCLLHPILLLSSHTGNAIAALVKILESKCFITNFENPTQQELVTLRSTVDCVGFVLDQIRGKPTLTREVLTPKLPHIIGSLIEVTVLIPEHTIPVLSKLLMTNTTTFRPFGTKFENSLKNILNDGDNYTKLNAELRSMLLKSLALVSFILSREKQADLWKENVTDLISEIKSVVSIYEACIELSQDSDYLTKLNYLPKLPEDISKLKMVFGSLSIDINESPVEIFKVSQRLSILTDLLLAYIEISTPTSVSIPFGNYITIGEILGSLNTNFTPVKRDIRDPATREMVEQAVIESKLAGIKILKTLINKFKGELYPHMYRILAILDAAIPVKTFRGKIKVDEKLVYENETLITTILSTASDYLNLTERFNDMTVLGRLVEAALVLKESRSPPITSDSNTSSQPVQHGNGHRKKGGKNKSTVSLSDMLSHQQLFMTPPSLMTLKTLRNFFNSLLTKCELSPGKLSLILRFILIDAVSNLDLIKNNNGNADRQQIIQLLENALLFPGKTDNSVSIIPMIANLIGTDSKIFSLLTNPRFPLLPKKSNYSGNGGTEQLEEEEEALNTEEEEEKEARLFAKGELPIPAVENNKRTSEDEIQKEDGKSAKKQHVEKTNKQVTSEHGDMVYHKTESAATALKKMQHEIEKESHHPRVSLVDDIARETEFAADDDVLASEDEEAEEDEDMGSDFEIPEINVEDD